MQTLLDIELIKQLKAKYCYYTDGFFADRTNCDRLLREVFMEETELDFGSFGKYKGIKEVENFFRNVVWVSLSFCHHRVTNPIITILGDKEATGIWSFFVPCTLRENSSAMWLCGTYDERYEKHGGNWYIKNIKANIIFGTPFHKGWVEENMFPNG